MIKPIAIIIGIALFSQVTLRAQKQNIQYQRSEFTSPLKIGKRLKAVKKTMIYARIQPYDLYSNYLHRWIDRPLFLSRELRNYPDRTRRSFIKDIELVKKYDIDGFTMLGNAYKNRYRNYLGIVKKAKPKGFSFMPGLAWCGVPYKQYLENARLGLRSKYSPRINGKVPFFSYGSMPLANIENIREKLAKDGCKNLLLFDDFCLNYNKPVKHLENTTREIQRKLNVVDGLVMTNYHMDRNPLEDYTLTKKFYFDLDEKYFAPLLEKVYGESRNKGKLLGFNIRHGYIGHMSGTNEAEMGTAQLRQAMDTALLFNPDIISLVEWNEANENTSFQPTIYNSNALQRIIRFYACKLKKLPLRSITGDDLDLPNLIVSSRQVLALGEKYRIELLNVPDSEKNEKYKVQLILKNQNNKVIKTFPTDSFKTNNLTAITYTIPTEQLAAEQAVIPELIITNTTGKKIKLNNLQYSRLTPSVCWNFKEVRQPIRDMLFPAKSKFTAFKRKTDGSYQVNAEINTKEPLASVEVLDNENEVFAVDNVKEFDLDHNYLFSVSFSTKKSGLRNTTIKIPGVNDFTFKPWSYPYAGFGKMVKKADSVRGKLLFFGHGAKILLAVPKKAEDAVIKFAVDGLGKFEFPVKKILAKGKLGMELPHFTFVKVERMNKLADHPVDLNSISEKFSVTLTPEFQTQCFQLRAVTKSGKIYRSRPIFPDIYKGKQEAVNVFSASQGKAVTLSVPSEKIIDINYNFTPQYGDILRAQGQPSFDGTLGAGFNYIAPMRYGYLPKNAKTTSPRWFKHNNYWSLKFDGIGNYLIFPAETLPHGSFTMEFDCKTDSTKNQALFRHNSHRPGSLLTYIIDGKLKAEFVSMGINYLGKYNKLPMDIPFPCNRWNKVKIKYDLHNITFTVNDKSTTQPFKLRASKPTSAIFGGFSSSDRDLRGKNLNFFSGELRSLRIRHNASK
jgi:hypothetical protein